jgi:hypothetical protein
MAIRPAPKNKPHIYLDKGRFWVAYPNGFEGTLEQHIAMLKSRGLTLAAPKKAD